jgi:MFS family permease
LLSMCLSQPIVSRLSYIFNRKSIILASIMMLGIGSLVCESTSAMALLLTGRTIQGLGAGGLMVLSYALYVDLESLYGDLESPYANSESLYGDMGSLSAPRFLAAISLFVAAGTVCGPFLGAALSGHHHWVAVAPMLQSLKLTIAPALDFSTKHPSMPSARGAGVQRQRRPREGPQCCEAIGSRKTIRSGLCCCCTLSHVDRPLACGLKPRW